MVVIGATVLGLAGVTVVVRLDYSEIE